MYFEDFLDYLGKNHTIKILCAIFVNYSFNSCYIQTKPEKLLSKFSLKNLKTFLTIIQSKKFFCITIVCDKLELGI